jgi:hypothetical protein
VDRRWDNFQKEDVWSARVVLPLHIATTCINVVGRQICVPWS